jgi:signal transduction histidine kinase
MFARISGLIVYFVAVMMPLEAPAQGGRAAPFRLLDQSDLRGRFYCEILVALRGHVTAETISRVTLRDSRDLGRLSGDAHAQTVKTYLHERYHAGPIGAVVTLGSTEAGPPPAGEIGFRGPRFLVDYGWQSAAIAAAILFQAALISILLYERRRRGRAETEARHRMAELAHFQRQAIAGELTSSLAHELNQPLGAILTNTETAEIILHSGNPDLGELKEILADIRQDDLRASQVIAHMRNLLKKTPFELKEIDANKVMRDAFDVMQGQASTRNVALNLQTCSGSLVIKGDAVQLQQVFINLIVNAMDAMASTTFGRNITGRTDIDKGRALISILDSGPGIPEDKLNDIFERFVTTKEQGMGIGLSIARTIVQAHHGQIWAENRSAGGAVFWISLPLA